VGGTFRHPVYGNRESWVDQKAQPFLGPAVEATEPAFLEAALLAVDNAFREGGF
jgi:hypothetical protein